MPILPPTLPLPPEILVVDSSVVAALLFGEPEAPLMIERFRGARLVAPEWIAIELANVCIKKARRQPELADRLIEAYHDLSLLNLELHPVELLPVLPLAHATRLSFYDACYLWLARRLDAALVTLDARLAATANP